jgi:glucokinase
MSNLLAGDIGGTKTLLGIFAPAADRPRPIVTRTFTTLDHTDLPSMIAAFLAETSIDRAAIDTACFGVAGPVVDEAVTLTNVPWRVDARGVTAAFGFRRVALLNDLEAMGYSVTVLQPSELHVLQAGAPDLHGNMALIAAGTGLGEALLHRIDGRVIPSPTEAGHADFAARTEREIALVRDLIARVGRADIEHVVSGHGLINIHRVAHRAQPDGACRANIDLAQADAPAAITAAALDRRCPGCVETLDLFVDAYGAEAGNLALRSVATGGVFVGGGIAPKLLPALTTGTFVRAFCAKPPLDGMLAKMPVSVILNPEAGLIGAAVYAATH